MKQLNDKLDSISNTIATINATVKSINERLEELIKALHDYDDDLSYEPQQGACSKHDAASWEQEDELNKRMDIIGQNGNTGEHYTSHHVSNEEADEDAFNDYGERVGKDKNKSNNSAKRTGKKSAIVEHQKYPPHKY